MNDLTKAVSQLADDVALLARLVRTRCVQTGEPFDVGPLRTTKLLYGIEDRANALKEALTSNTRSS